MKKRPKSVKILFARGPILRPKIDQTKQKYHAKKFTKNVKFKKLLFGAMLAIFNPKPAEIKGFLVDFGYQLSSFFELFLGYNFRKDFWSFLSKKAKNRKSEKVCFVLVFAMYCEDRLIEKKAWRSTKAGRKNMKF